MAHQGHSTSTQSSEGENAMIASTHQPCSMSTFSPVDGSVFQADCAFDPVAYDSSGVCLSQNAGQDQVLHKNNLGRGTSKDPPPLASALNLDPHPEGGWFRETWRSTHKFHPDGYPGNRRAATAIYFVLGHDEVSRWHRVRSDEMWLWQRGSALELILGGSGERPSTTPSVIQLGPSIEEGEEPQGLVPGGVWQMARTVRGDTLVSCIVAPGFDFEDLAILNI